MTGFCPVNPKRWSALKLILAAGRMTPITTAEDGCSITDGGNLPDSLTLQGGQFTILLTLEKEFTR